MKREWQRMREEEWGEKKRTRGERERGERGREEEKEGDM